MRKLGGMGDQDPAKKGPVLGGGKKQGGCLFGRWKGGLTKRQKEKGERLEPKSKKKGGESTNRCVLGEKRKGKGCGGRRMRKTVRIVRWSEETASQKPDGIKRGEIAPEEGETARCLRGLCQPEYEGGKKATSRSERMPEKGA